MIWSLFGLHVLSCGLLVAAGDRLGNRVFVLAAVAPAITAAWALGVIDRSTRTEARLDWVAGLDLELSFSVGPLAALLTLVVSGIGVLVFVYSAGYFPDGTAGVGRFGATLLAFSASMVGLVWADSIWTLFVFWELTSVTSFLLVGHKNTDEEVRLAARRALLVTVAGGLSLLAGFVIIADAAGTTRLSEMQVVDGTSGTVAAILILVAAATKSAQVPFHVWLPGAMAAPTPVSAYLHSATMVKAGVVIVALAGPVVGSTGPWTPLGLVIGLSSMVWGAIGALRHRDAKLILAWGTISQLGLMIALLVVGTPKAIFAAVGLIVAHAVFKAALFMVVGEIDVRTATRRIDELSGLRRSMPTAFAVALISAASMAGLPPMLGFPAKEAAVEAALGLAGTERIVLLTGIITGSILTVAYTTRLILGLFGSRDRPPTAVEPSRWPMTAPIVGLGVATVVGFVGLGWVSGTVRSAAVQLEPGAEVYSLLRWPGPTTALYISTAIVIAGSVLGWAITGRSLAEPPAVGAQLADRMVAIVLRSARRITATVQHGSLPVYLVTMAAVSALAAIPFALAIDIDSVYVADSPGQLVLAVLVVAGAVAAARVDSRLGAALGLGAVGLAVTGLFIVHGAPDLALTQLLVETVVVVGFVVGLGHLNRRFPSVGNVWKSVRLVIASLTGLAVGGALVASSSGPAGAPPVQSLLSESVETGGGNNAVNVILTDIRALDTLGELMVLVVVGIGILALATPTDLPHQTPNRDRS